MKKCNKAVISLVLALILALPFSSVCIADDNDIVIDALDYSREVVSVIDEYDYSDVEHEVCIPMLNISSKNAERFNKKIYDENCSAYDELISYTEENKVYNINYESDNYNGLVGIVVEYSAGLQFSEFYTEYKFYYYDIANDCELTLEEYAARLGYELDELESLLAKMPADDGFSQDYLNDESYLVGFIADDDETTVVFANIASHNGTVIYDVAPIEISSQPVAASVSADTATKSETESAIESASADVMPKLCDFSNLLTADEQSEIESLLEETVSDVKLDVVIITVDSLDGKTAEAYADDYYDYNGYGIGDDHSGILLLVSIGERDYAVSTTGKAIDVYTKSICEQIVDSFLSDLSDGYYFDAFKTFAEECKYYAALNSGSGGYEYEGNYVRPMFPLTGTFIIGSLLVGFIIALISVGVMKGKLRSVRSQRAADNYVVDGSLKLTNSFDMFLYRTVTRTAKPKETDSGNDTHVGSSGTSHGGTSGKF